MKILVVAPYKEPEARDIDGSLESMQEVVDGYIEAVYPFEEHVPLSAMRRENSWGCL